MRSPAKMKDDRRRDSEAHFTHITGYLNRRSSPMIAMHQQPLALRCSGPDLLTSYFRMCSRAPATISVGVVGLVDATMAGSTRWSARPLAGPRRAQNAVRRWLRCARLRLPSTRRGTGCWEVLQVTWATGPRPFCSPDARPAETTKGPAFLRDPSVPGGAKGDRTPDL